MTGDERATYARCFRSSLIGYRSGSARTSFSRGKYGDPVRLNHVNLCSSNVPELTAILERHFDYRIVDQGTVPNFPGATNPGSAYAMLIGKDASNVVITEIDADPEGRSAYPVGFHFGLIQDTADAVHAKHAELAEAGLKPEPVGPSFDVLGATWTAFYCHLGDGLQIEVNHRTHSDLLDTDLH